MITVDNKTYIPPNPYYAAQDRLRGDLSARLDWLIEAQKPDEEMLQLLRAIHAQLEKLTKGVTGIDKTLDQFNCDKVDYVTALYAAAIDTSGMIVRNTNAGRWIADAFSACKQKQPEPSIGDIAVIATKPQVLNSYLKELERTAGEYPGLAEKMSDRDMRRFVSLAQSVWNAIRPQPSLLPSIAAESAA